MTPEKDIIQQLKSWWNGKAIPEPPNSPFILPHIQRPKAAIIFENIIQFLLREYKWLIGIIVAIIIAFMQR
ncbi:MAG: hypothetical protein OEL53_14175 [Rhodospirillales bacterium]|nr:hypothetical protein [Rhodospirillales bacterium]